MALRVSCPYCNTSFTAAAVPASGRVPCPRCGDAFPVRTGEAEAEGESPEAVSAVSLDESSRPRSSQAKSSSRVPAIAAVAAILALAIGAGWYYFRDWAGGNPAQSDPSTIAAAPTSLHGLAFVPTDANLLFALQPGPIIAYAERSGQDPRVLLSQAGFPPSLFVALDRAGVPLQQIDHIAVGAHVPDSDDFARFRVAMALVLRTSLDDEDRFLEELQARPVERRGRKWYEATASVIPGVGRISILLVKATPEVWVFGWSEEDLEPAARGAGASGYPSWLDETAAERLPADAAIWLASDDERWSEKPIVRLALAQFKRKDLLPILAEGQAVAAGLSLGEQPRLRVSIRCRDSQIAEQLKSYFEEKVTEPGTRHGSEGEWAMLDGPVDPLQVPEKLKGLLNKGK